MIVGSIRYVLLRPVFSYRLVSRVYIIHVTLMFNVRFFKGFRWFLTLQFIEWRELVCPIVWRSCDTYDPMQTGNCHGDVHVVI